jgi:thioredoxin-like negative regulator of GroEL
MSQEAFARSNGKAPAVALLVAQSLTAFGRYEEAAQVLREFLRDHASAQETATARRWLEQLAANGKSAQTNHASIATSPSTKQLCTL